jgi:GNAT superfamily N-acetyltransferase
MSRVNFLTLPRELRDIVYEYLYQPAQLQWSWDGTEQQCIVHVHLRYAPSLNMLLVHRQIYAEYQDLINQPLSATVEWYRDRHPGNPLVSKRSTGRKLASLPKVPTIVLKQLRSVVILIARPSTMRSPNVWKRTEGFTSALKKAAPGVSTISVSFCEDYKGRYCESECQKDSYMRDYIDYNKPPKSMGPLYKKPPRLLEGLSLVYRGQGLFVEFALEGRMALRNHKRLPSHRRIHQLNAAGLFLYTTDTPDLSQIEAGVFFDHWRYGEYPEELESRFNVDDAARIRGRERRMLDWAEEHVQRETLKRLVLSTRPQCLEAALTPCQETRRCVGT